MSYTVGKNDIVFCRRCLTERAGGIIRKNIMKTNGDRNRGVAWTYYNPPSDLESDCIGEVQAPSKVEEDHMHMEPTAAQIWSEVSFDSLVGM
jgi:hypothetical protein